MHKYAVIALPFIFSNLRCFREKNLHNNAILRSNMKCIHQMLHKYAVIALPFIFSNLRCFREKNLHNNAILRIWHVVSYNFAVQHHPSITDAEDEEMTALI
ncbi:hypothetical protein T05_16007 [Trichinella murrelli]|uniref:Uncharacterized protein n=1 Tax=Trichinella murrelli TaxID=144512 RepID=A0A0V0UBM5_9BILA|nr:hypothetical protein T05_16007 [Trichinella murrelli]